MISGSKFTGTELLSFLDRKVEEYNTLSFIERDPISIPHGFQRKEDIEIAGFLAATLSWGQRVTIINNSMRLIKLMEFEPFEFLTLSADNEFNRFLSFVHRTFNGEDCMFLLNALRNIYQDHGGMENVFKEGFLERETILGAISNFRKTMLLTPHFSRSAKHISDPVKGSAAKRINMFLRWMVRKDTSGVDFGLWNSIPMSKLMCPLDLHSGRIARKLGLLTRKQDDWKAVEELTSNLRTFDPLDPVKYDFALFGLGIYEKY